MKIYVFLVFILLSGFIQAVISEGRINVIANCDALPFKEVSMSLCRVGGILDCQSQKAATSGNVDQRTATFKVDTSSLYDLSSADFVGKGLLQGCRVKAGDTITIRKTKSEVGNDLCTCLP